MEVIIMNEEKKEMYESEAESKKTTKKGSKKSKRRRSARSNKTDSNRNSYSDYRGDNDIRWYTKNPQLLRSAASLSYFTPLGASPQMSQLPNVAMTGSLSYADGVGLIPGIMVLKYIAGPSTSDNYRTDPVELASQDMFTFCRKENSGYSNWQKADGMIYLLAMDEIYSMWAQGVRAYGLLRLFSQTNRYLAKTLVEACGFNYADLAANAADFNNTLNVLAARIAAFPVPSSFPYFQRHMWLVSNVFVDEDVTKPQMYLHRPDLFRKYSETEYDQGGALLAYNYKWSRSTTADWQDSAAYAGEIVSSDGLYTLGEFKLLMDDMLQRVESSSDVGIIGGDIRKAYGDKGLFTVGAIGFDYVTVPMKNDEVLSQISNFQACAVHYAAYSVSADRQASFDIKQIVGTESQVPQIDYTITTAGVNNGVYNMVPKLLNFHASDITPEMTMVASRWLTNWISDEGESGEIIYKCSSSGSEIGTGIEIHEIYPSGSHGRVKLHTYTPESANVQVDENISSKISNFDWHPPIMFVTDTRSQTTPAGTVKGVMLDYANYTYPGRDSIRNMNEAAILSLFDVPQLGTY